MTAMALPNSAARFGNTVLRPAGTVSVPEDGNRNRIRSWKVIHACEHARDVLAVVEGQVTNGMQPYIVTPRGEGSAQLYLSNKEVEQDSSLSLLRAWQDVRNWRKSLLECNPEYSADLVHTHSFASGMAGVRNLSCVVYDPEACIEDLAVSAGQCERGSWMARSFRVAEQFIVSRAEAIIVHTQEMKAAMQERGAPAQNVFVIPDPLPQDAEAPIFKSNFLQERLGIADTTVTFFLPRRAGDSTDAVSPSLLAVLEAFAATMGEVPDVKLLLEATPATSAVIAGHAERFGIAKHVLCIEDWERDAVLQNADIIIATGEVPDDPVQARRPSEVCVQALCHGKALLAADVPANRECSPDGSGCLWFQDGDVRDLAHRMSFLGNNAAFRKSLGISGRAYILQARSSVALGQQYDAAYRHAVKQKRTLGPGQQALNLRPLTSVG
jgi:glycosyltransferase involved in cell wall biosynthesis